MGEKVKKLFLGFILAAALAHASDWVKVTRSLDQNTTAYASVKFTGSKLATVWKKYVMARTALST